MIDFTDEQEVEAGFAYYRSRGFPYPKLTTYEIIHIFRKLQSTNAKIIKEGETLLDCYDKHIEVQPIGDIKLAVYFHPHIWESHAVGMRSSVQSFNIDKSLRKVMRMCLKHYGEITEDNVRVFLRLVNGTQICSNFRPTVAKAIYDYFRPHNVLDMSTGYGGRLIGFLASSCKGIYIGFDPSIKSCGGNLEIARVFGVKDRVDIVCSPFEDVGSISPEVDLAFTSTPYFAKEIYEEDNPEQSRERYPLYKDWVRGFLKPMMKRTRETLSPDGIMALNIADVKIKNIVYPLERDTIRIARHLGFKLRETIRLDFFGFGKGLEKQKTEPIFVFEKA
jgi:hypothetical protein